MLRFAPSPTGDMHIGNLRVAIFNHILSKQLNEKLIIRIEDTDKKRNIKNKDKEILEILNLFSIEYDRVIYQSESLKYHQKLAMQLVSTKKAFACFCGDDKLDELRQIAKNEKKPFRYDGFCQNLSNELVLEVNAPFSIRAKQPQSNIKFTDLLKGDFDYKPFDIDSFIILRHDKTPTYNYACAIDDMLLDISTVIRGEDHLSNTPKQIYIRDILEYKTKINYIHLPMILNAQSGKKMSKRDDESSIRWLIEEGFLPSAIANYLVLLGNKTPCEIFTLEEAIKWFDIKSISKSAAKFDISKLRFVNKKHLEIIDEIRLSKILGFDDKDIGKLAKVYLEEASTIKELKSKLNLIFSKKLLCVGFEDEFDTLKNIILKEKYFNSFIEFKAYLSKESGLKGKSLFKPLRYLLTGANDGPNLSDIYPLIKNYLGEIVKC